MSTAGLVRVPTSTVDLPQLEITFDVGPGVVTAGDDLHGQAQLTNLGADPIRFFTSPTLVGSVRRPGDDYMAGRFRGWITAVGTLVDLAERESRELHLIVGTASCLRDSPRAIPAGTYEIVATLSVNFGAPDGGLAGRQVLVLIGPSITVTTSLGGSNSASETSRVWPSGDPRRGTGGPATRTVFYASCSRRVPGETSGLVWHQRLWCCREADCRWVRGPRRTPVLVCHAWE